MNIAANHHSPGVSWGAVGTGPTPNTPRALTSERLGPTGPGLCGLHRTKPHPKIRHGNKQSEPASALPLSTQTALENNSSILYQNLASPWHWQGAKRVSWCLTLPRQPVWVPARTLVMNTYHWGFWWCKPVLCYVLQLSLELVKFQQTIVRLSSQTVTLLMIPARSLDLLGYQEFRLVEKREEQWQLQE